MIYECIIVPCENPPSLTEVKRALLTYDKIKIVDPGDRDLIPSNAFMSTIMGVPMIGLPVGPVRPMGKKRGYDHRFQRVVDECQPAFRQGLLETVSTYDQKKTEGFTIGGVPMGGYPLDPRFVFQVYRSMSQNQEYLSSSIADDKDELLSTMHFGEEISLEGRGDGSINNIPALPFIVDEALNEAQSEFITRIARARIAALIKFSGFCEAKNLVPIFPSDAYGKVISKLLENTRVLLAEDEDPQWIKKNRILDICHEEFLDYEVLDSLSIEETIRLRTKAWGVQAEARESLFESITEIAKSIRNEADFEEATRSIIEEYRLKAQTLELERKNLRFKIKCEVGIGLLGGIVTLPGLLAQLQSPMSMALTLAGGGIFALQKSKEYVPAWRELKLKEEHMKRRAGFGIQNFYSQLGRA